MKSLLNNVPPELAEALAHPMMWFGLLPYSLDRRQLPRCGAVEGLLMRLLALWEQTGGSAVANRV